MIIYETIIEIFADIVPHDKITLTVFEGRDQSGIEIFRDHFHLRDNDGILYPEIELSIKGGDLLSRLDAIVDDCKRAELTDCVMIDVEYEIGKIKKYIRNHPTVEIRINAKTFKIEIHERQPKSSI